jgi:hypothetical protein
VPGHPEILACRDAAAVPDPARPGEITAMTAQHAVRQLGLVPGAAVPLDTAAPELIHR